MDPDGAMIDSTIQMIRRIGTKLRAIILDDLGLSAALDWQAREFTVRMGIDTAALEVQVPATPHPLRVGRVTLRRADQHAVERASHEHLRDFRSQCAAGQENQKISFSRANI